MIQPLDHRHADVAERIYALQQASYAVERDLIEHPDFPPLRVRAEDIQQEAEQFLGYWYEGDLVGVISFAATPRLIDIGRMIVHPRMFRRGVASTLLQAVEQFAPVGATLTVSTAEKNDPAVRLYEKHGYRTTQRTTLSDGLVLVRLSKDSEERSSAATQGAASST